MLESISPPTTSAGSQPANTAIAETCFSCRLELQKNVIPALFKLIKLSEKFMIQVHINLSTFHVKNYTFPPIRLNSKLFRNKEQLTKICK